MRRVLAAVAPLALVLFLAPTAAALTVAEVTAAAEALLDDFEDLEVLIDACPDGVCPGAHGLINALDALNDDLVVLHALRVALGACSCTYLDGVIDDIDDLSDLLLTTTGGWDTQG